MMPVVQSGRVLEEIVSQLQDFGLTGNEARVMTFLAKVGPARAGEIARALNINRTETYRTLRNLQRRGLVESTLEHPVRFQAIPFDQCLDVLIQERKAEVRGLEEEGEKLRKRFSALSMQVGVPAVERFQVLEGRGRIDQKLLAMCEDAGSEISRIAAPSEIVHEDATGLLDVLGRLSRENRRIRVITEISTPTVDVIEKLKDAVEFRHLDLTRRPVPRVSIVDDDEALFEIVTSEGPSARAAEEVAFWISSRSFVKNLQAYFQEAWENATPANARLEALKRGVAEEEMKIVKGRVEVRHKLSEMLRSAKRSVDYWTTMKGVEILADARQDEFSELKRRNVRIRIIAPIAKENIASARKLIPVAELRHSEALGPARIAIVDHEHLLFYERIPDDDSLDVGADVGFWTNSRPFVEMMSRAYEEVWKGVLAIYTPRRRRP